MWSKRFRRPRRRKNAFLLFSSIFFAFFLLLICNLSNLSRLILSILCFGMRIFLWSLSSRWLGIRVTSENNRRQQNIAILIAKKMLNTECYVMPWALFSLWNVILLFSLWTMNNVILLSVDWAIQNILENWIFTLHNCLK